MQRIGICLMAAGMSVVTIIYALYACETNEPEVNPYGFVKADMYYVTQGEVASYGYPAITCVSTATEEDSGGTGISYSAQHSRFGLKGKGSVRDMPVGILLELDFWVIASNANARPRMRLAYGWIEVQEGLQLRFGQQWDIFSPLHPVTNNTNANMWYNGNYSFRRTQLQVGYSHDFDPITGLVQASMGEAAKEGGGGDDWLGADNRSGIPMIQGRAAVEENIEIGVSGCYAVFGEDIETSTKGISLDAQLPLHELLALKGEFCWGENLNDANIFTLAGADTETYGFWFNVISKPFTRLHVVMGFGNEHIIEATEEIEDNTTVYGDVIVPLSDFFKVAGEYQWIRTSYENGDEYTGGIIDLSAMVTF